MHAPENRCPQLRVIKTVRQTECNEDACNALIGLVVSQAFSRIQQKLLISACRVFDNVSSQSQAAVWEIVET